MIKKLLIYAPVQIFSALSLFALIAVHTRFLHPESYGFLAVLLVIIEVSRSVLVQWINNCLIRFYPSAESKKQKQIYTVAVRWLLANIFFSVIVIGVLVALLTEFEWRIFLAVYVFFVVKAIYLFAIEFARVNQATSYYRRSVMAQAMLSIVMTVAFLSLNPTIVMALLALVVSYSIAIITCIGTMEWQLEPSTETEIKKELFSYGAPLILSGLMGVLVVRSDRVFIANLSGFEQAGQYSAISNLLFGIMALVFMVIALPLYPELTKFATDRERLITQHKTYGGLLFALSAPSCIGLCLLAPLFVGVFLGDAYANVNLTTFYLLVAAALLSNLRGHFLDHGLQFTLSTKYLPRIMATVLIVQILAAFVFIPQFGAVGAAIGIVIAMFVGFVMTAVVGFKAGYHYPIPQAITQTVIATSVMAMSILGIQGVIGNNGLLELLLMIIVAVASYGLMHFLLDSFQIRSYLLNKLRGRENDV